MFYVKQRAIRSISLQRDNQVVLHCIIMGSFHGVQTCTFFILFFLFIFFKTKHNTQLAPTIHTYSYIHVDIHIIYDHRDILYRTVFLENLSLVTLGLRRW